MSLISKYLSGFSFRTTTPSLEPGRTVNVFVSEYDEATGEGIALIGDTELHVRDFDPEDIDKRVAVEVTEYDADTGVARGEFVDVIGASSYTG
ncbi:MAG: TRAM domain-containing protein [Halopenitus sp.]